TALRFSGYNSFTCIASLPKGTSDKRVISQQERVNGRVKISTILTRVASSQQPGECGKRTT
ncbi:hypothetical protein, partial [Devosia neptuniae]|uniref:hypothetical protein n=1 Tax=Devosia neptuniae TaxID=191302 RepID=UPI0022AF0F57